MMVASTKLKVALNIRAPAAPETMRICGKNKRTTTKKNNTSPADAGLFLLVQKILNEHIKNFPLELKINMKIYIFQKNYISRTF